MVVVRDTAVSVMGEVAICVVRDEVTGRVDEAAVDKVVAAVVVDTGGGAIEEDIVVRP